VPTPSTLRKLEFRVSSTRDTTALSCLKPKPRPLRSHRPGRRSDCVLLSHTSAHPCASMVAGATSLNAHLINPPSRQPLLLRRQPSRVVPPLASSRRRFVPCIASPTAHLRPDSHRPRRIKVNCPGGFRRRFSRCLDTHQATIENLLKSMQNRYESTE
jgi:hypothetical protein